MNENLVVKDIDDFIETNHITKIFLDVDGVIFASCDAVIQILNDRYGGDFKGSDVCSWDFQCCYPNMTSEEIEDTFADEKFFEIVKPIKGALEFIDRYKDKIVIVTKAVTDNFIHKRKWFDEHEYSDVPIIVVPLGMSKSIINMNTIDGWSLFIDDSTNNLNDSNADYKIQFREYNDDKEREWQKGWGGLVMYQW